jgi:hypothetical protein
MSRRISKKSELSPSITRGSSGIDLGKNSGIDMGRKSEPSITSGGIGITQEITSVGGINVSGGIEVDITPVDFGVTVSPEGTVAVNGGAEVPGGLIGISGGIEVDLNTGEITGGSIGGEVGGLGINVSNSRKGGIGIEFTVQIPGTPIELSLGFGFPPKEEATPTPTPGPTPLPPNPGPDQGVDVPNTSDLFWVPIRTTRLSYEMFGSVQSTATITPTISNKERNQANITATRVPFDLSLAIQEYGYNGYTLEIRKNSLVHRGTRITGAWPRTEELQADVAIFKTSRSGVIAGFIDSGIRINNFLTIHRANEAAYLLRQRWGFLGDRYTYHYAPTDYVKIGEQEPPPLFPNPPPRKQNMDACCRESIKLQRLIVRHLGAARGANQETLPDGVRGIGIVQDGIAQAFPFIVRKRWVDPNAKENESIPILNDRQLALVLGGMIERLERVLGTAEFYKDSDKKLRQSEGNMLSWLTGKNKDFRYPDPNDFWLNTDDGVINEKLLEVRSIADGLRYQIEALNRLERILPIAELKDSSIPARWIYPNGKGQLRVGNLIHLCEYMIRKSDKDMGYWPQKITIKAANPAIKDDEPITTDVHSQADMLRVILQQILDVEGDGDMGSNYDLRRTYLDIMAFQMTAKSTKYLEAITEYLGFDITEEVSKIPIPFDPFAGQDRSVIESWWIKYGFGTEKTNFPTKNTESEIEQLSGALLQNSELEVSTIKFGSIDEKKDPKTLKEALLEILKHSSASAAAVTEVATEGALDRVVDAAGIAQKLASFLMRRDIRESLGIGDLDNWISSAEKGYTDNLESESLRFPESNSLEPYGRPTTQNPTIREIDTKDPKAD